jgi:hypothetical protein
VSPTETVGVGAIAHRAVPATPAHHVTLKQLLPWTEPMYSQQQVILCNGLGLAHVYALVQVGIAHVSYGRVYMQLSLR